MVPLALPPFCTTAEPPTAAPLSAPNTRSTPPLKSCTPMSLPPALTISLPPLAIVVAMRGAAGQDLDSAAAEDVEGRAGVPAEMVTVWPPLTTTGVKICAPLPPALMSTPALA